MPFFTKKALRARGKAEALGGAGMGGTDTSMDQPGSTTLPGGDEESEVAPPGREKQVKALKKTDVTNPFAVAWASYNKSKGKKRAKKVESVIVENAMSPAIFKVHMRRYAEAGLENFGDKKAEPFKAEETVGDAKFPEPTDSWKTSEDEAHIGFKALSNKLAKKGDVRDPDAVAAAIGRKKYGAKGMAAKAKAGRQGEVPPGILSGDPVLHDSEAEDGEGRFVVQSEAIEAIGVAPQAPLMRKGVKAAPPAQPDLITKSGDAQDIPLGSFKDDLQRKQSLRKMMKGNKDDRGKQKESEAIKKFHEAYA